MVKYYHISSIQNKENILKEGIISDCSEIFVTTNLDQIPFIANNQIFTDSYSIFLINEDAFNSEIINDDVADFGSQYQFILNQQRINPQFITFMKDEIWNHWELVEHCVSIVNKKIGFPDDYIHINVSTSSDWCEHYNKKYNTNIIPLKQ